MNAKNFLLALLLFNVNTILYAQNSAPDFSGTWRLNLEKSKLPKGTNCQGEACHLRSHPFGKQSRVEFLERTRFDGMLLRVREILSANDNDTDGPSVVFQGTLCHDLLDLDHSTDDGCGS